MTKLQWKLSILFIPTWLVALPSHEQPSRRANWQNLDLKQDSVFGVSTERAYRELLRGKQATTVIVAVIDGGVDTGHEALKSVLWINGREAPGNGIDDDHNGYIDDLHGWNFIGGEKADVAHDSKEYTRIFHRDSARYAGYTPATVAGKDRAGFLVYRTAKAEYDSVLNETKTYLGSDTSDLLFFDSLALRIGKDTPTIADLLLYTARNESETRAIAWAIKKMKIEPGFYNFVAHLRSLIAEDHAMLDFWFNADYDPRSTIVGDDYRNEKQRYYGNANVTGPDAHHGTHVSGIIGAVRQSGMGVEGVADHVQLMCIRAIPDGDERDKDVANAIRYAADNGAKVINMSFGKYYTWDKKVVDEAVKYAMRKDILMIHIAGNEGRNLDDPIYAWFPSKRYEDGSGEAKAWITVGASDQLDDSALVADFSNYGRKNVDVFAPGVAIYSCYPGSKYAYDDGTSMAAPVVAGVAALIREYYPKLSAVQVKEIILRSVVKPAHTVIVRDRGVAKTVYLSDICMSGGVVNAYNALKLAATY
jgi:subtilisin family serine protease